MPKDDREVLARLKSELEFLEKGGYWKPSSREQLTFQDSPTCLNYKHLGDSRPCSECVLFRFVPADRRKEKIPCRHIPLNEQSETIDSLHRQRTQESIETAVSRWLRSAIQELEDKQARNQSSAPGANTGTEMVSLPLRDDVNLQREAARFPKCANPECSARFLYNEGRLLRFHQNHEVGELPSNTRSVQHFWLCSACSESYTLECDGVHCVTISLSLTGRRAVKEPHTIIAF